MHFCKKKQNKKKKSLIALIILNNNINNINLSIILLKIFQASEQVHYIINNLASTETGIVFLKLEGGHLLRCKSDIQTIDSCVTL